MTMLNFDESWNDAEDTVYNLLLTATNAEDGKTATRGRLPPTNNVWALTSGGGNNVETTWADTITTMHLFSKIEGRYIQRADAMKTAMQIINACPIMEMGNVGVFRIRADGLPTIDEEIVELANESRRAIVYKFVLLCEMVFCTTETFD